MNKLEAETHTKQFAYKIARFINVNFYSDFMLNSVRYDWASSRRSSRGGIYTNGPGINIALAIHGPEKEQGARKLEEYRSYNSNKTIGGFYYTKKCAKLESVVCHEVAHSVQFFSYHKTGVRCKPHGRVFKKYYAAIREEFINPYLEDQVSLKQEYDDLLHLFKGTATNVRVFAKKR
jgi:hypothetical protein